jgi:hypothetical protein
MSNNPRNIIEQNVYTPTPGEAQGVWKPWEDLQAMYTNTWPGSVNPLAVEYFIVSGGGNGGTWGNGPVSAQGGGGGGAGGILTGTDNFDLNTSITVIIGAGAGQLSTRRNGGPASTFGSYSSPNYSSAYPAGAGTYSSGGGGSTSAGETLQATKGGNGGGGTVFDWEDTPITVAGGGGGGGGSSAGNAGGGTGFGGGANGRSSIDSQLGSFAPNRGLDGAANTGGGGGGAGGYYNQASGTSWVANANQTGQGGSGVVWIRYPQFYFPARSTINVAAGYPVINNGYRIYKWITSGAITF